MPDNLVGATVTYRNVAGFLYAADVLRDDGAWLWLRYGYFNGVGRMLDGYLWMPKASCNFISAPKQQTTPVFTSAIR